MTPAPPARDPRSARYGSPSDRQRVLSVEGLRVPTADDGGQWSLGPAAVLAAVDRTRSALPPTTDTA